MPFFYSSVTTRKHAKSDGHIRRNFVGMAIFRRYSDKKRRRKYLVGKKKFVGNLSQIPTKFRQVPTDTIPTIFFIGSVPSVIGRNIFPTEVVGGKMSDKILTKMLLWYSDETWIRQNFQEPYQSKSVGKLRQAISSEISDTSCSSEVSEEIRSSEFSGVVCSRKFPTEQVSSKFFFYYFE